MSREHAKPPHPEVSHILTMVRYLLYLSFTVIGYLVLRKLGPVLFPVIAAGAVAYLLDGWVDQLCAKGMNRVAVVSGLLIAFLLVVTGILLVFVPIISSELIHLAMSFPAMFNSTSEWITEVTGLSMPTSWQSYMESGQLEAMVKEAVGPAATFTAAALGGVFHILGILTELLLVPVFAFYFLVDWDHMIARIRSFVPPRHRDNVGSIFKEIDSAVSGWIRGQLIVTSSLGVLYALAFKIIGVPAGLSIGAVVGLLTIIPFLGTLVGALMTAAVLLMSSPSLGVIIGVALTFLLLHLLEAAVLTPKLVGKRVGLGEVGALFAVVAGGKLLGITGVILAVPIAASVAVLLRRLLAYYEKSEFFNEEDEEAHEEQEALLP